MLYKKSSGVGGAWIDKKVIENGAKVKLVSETTPMEREFEGKPQTQNVAKIRIDGEEETKNIALNKPTINGLIDAFGEDSKAWIGQALTVYKERTTFGGKRGFAVYLLADGFEVTEDDGGYVVVARKGAKVVAPVVDDIKPEDIPFE